VRGFRGPFYHCGQTGHPYRFCPTQQVSALEPKGPTCQEAEPDRVQQVLSNRELRDVYIPIQLYNRPTIALFDTECDTSIIGVRLLLANADVQPTSNTLLAANGSSVPLEGNVKFHSKLLGKRAKEDENVSNNGRKGDIKTTHIESMDELIMEDYRKHEGQKDTDIQVADAVSDAVNRPGGVTAQRPELAPAGLPTARCSQSRRVSELDRCGRRQKQSC